MTSNICDIEKLVELFSLDRQNSEEDEDDNQQENIVAETGEKQQIENKITKKSPYAKLEKETKNREILDPEEYFLNESSSSTSGKKDWKKTPIWDITYKQNVSAEDVFLGVGFKNASTSSCENMIATIYLPGENRQNINLKVEHKSLTLDSPKFYLELNLPQPVNPKKGSAEYDKDNEKLIVTMVLNRELDFLNF